MIRLSISIEDHDAYNALENFIIDYQNKVGNSKPGIEKFRFLAVEGDSNELNDPDLLPWKWYEQLRQKIEQAYQQTNEHSIHEPIYYSTMPRELQNQLRDEMKAHLFNLRSSLKRDSIASKENIEDQGNLDQAINDYADRLKTVYIDARFRHYEGGTDYHEVLIELARSATTVSFEAIKNIKMNHSFFSVFLNSIQALTAVSVYLIEHYIDYFWGMIALAKAQQWLGVYVGGLSASDVDKLRNLSLGADARALNSERIEDEILRCFVFISRHWPKREYPEGVRPQLSKMLKSELMRNSTLIAERVIEQIHGKFERDYTVQDIKTKIENLIHNPKTKLYQYLIEFSSTSDSYIKTINHKETQEICFYDEHHLKFYINEKLRSYLFEGMTINETLATASQLNGEKRDLVAQFIDDAFADVMDPYNGILRHS